MKCWLLLTARDDSNDLSSSISNRSWVLFTAAAVSLTAFKRVEAIIHRLQMNERFCRAKCDGCDGTVPRPCEECMWKLKETGEGEECGRWRWPASLWVILQLVAIVSNHVLP